MDKGIEVEYMDLSNLSHDDSFVFIYVNIGKMSPNQASKYINKVRTELKLCRKLENKNIDYAIISCRSDGTKAVEVKVEHQDDTVNVISNFDEALMVVK